LELRKLLEPEKPIPHIDPTPSPTPGVLIDPPKKKSNGRPKKKDIVN